MHYSCAHCGNGFKDSSHPPQRFCGQRCAGISKRTFSYQEAFALWEQTGNYSSTARVFGVSPNAVRQLVAKVNRYERKGLPAPW